MKYVVIGSAFDPVDNNRDGHRWRYDLFNYAVENAEQEILDIYLPVREHAVGRVWKAVKDRTSFVWLSIAPSRAVLHALYCQGIVADRVQRELEAEEPTLRERLLGKS